MKISMEIKQSIPGLPAGSAPLPEPVGITVRATAFGIPAIVSPIVRGTTKALGQKHTLDKFYTKPTVAALCLDMLDLTDYDVIVEPSAGSGSFANHIPGCVALDLAPEHEGIIQQDFFEYAPDPGDTNKRVLVVGNPPFGQQGSLAVKFINHAATFAATVAFIVPRSFNKASIQARIDPYLHLRSSTILEPKSFTLDGVDYAVPCVFQIWDRRDTPRKVHRNAAVSEVIEFVHSNAEPDFTIRRVGGNSGKASIRLDVSAQSNYFVRNISTLGTSELVDLINGLHFPARDDSVGPRSLSKGELVEVLDSAVKER